MAANLESREAPATENTTPRRVRRGSFAFSGGFNPCPVCGRGFPSYRARRRHERRVHREVPAEGGRVLGGFIELGDFGGFRFTRERPGCPDPGHHIHGERAVFGARWPPDADVLRVARELGVPVGPGLFFVVEDGRGSRRPLVRGGI